MKTLLKLTFILLLFVGISSCSDDDDSPNGPPPTGTIELAVDVFAGEDVTFTGTLNDELGLESITITYTDWGLAKVISLTEEPLTYALSYSFTVSADADLGDHSIVISVENTSGKTTDFTVVVTVLEPLPKMFIVGTGFTDFPKVDWSVHADSVINMTEEATGIYTISDLAVAAGAEMKFIGQTGAWIPKNYGWNYKTADASETMINDEGSAVFIFKKAGTYDVSFNESDLSCTVTAKSQTDANITSLYIIGNGLKTVDGVNISESWWDDPSLSQQLTETSAGSGVFEITIVIDEASLITGNENYDEWGCFFYFAIDDYWGSPYGTIGSSSIVTDWYVNDPAISGGNTFDLVPDINENWDMYAYYLESYIAGGDGTYKITVDTKAMTCNVTKQ